MGTLDRERGWGESHFTQIKDGAFFFRKNNSIVYQSKSLETKFRNGILLFFSRLGDMMSSEMRVQVNIGDATHLFYN